MSIRRKPRIIRRDYNQAKVKYVDKLHGVSTTNLVHLINSTGISVSSVPTNGTSTPNSVSTISTLVSSRHDPPIGSNINRVNHENLHPVRIINPDCKASDPLTLVSLNCRSVKNKAMSICDILAITETWLGTVIDDHVLSDIIPSGYDILHTARSGSRGGGVAVVFKQGLNMKKIVSTTSDVHAYTHFEHLDCYVSTGAKPSRLCVIYRPPPSKQNGFTKTVFFDEWASYLDELAVAPQQLIITSDLNFHLDKPDSPDVHQFSGLLESHGLVQDVRAATHIQGHTLDVVITREDSSILRDTPLVMDPFLVNIRENSSVIMKLDIGKPKSTRKEITFRKLRAIPVKIITLRPNAPWYTEDIREDKHKRRKAERLWRRTKLTVHHQMFKKECRNVIALLIKAKKEHYSNKIVECGTESKQLFKLAKHLMGHKSEVILPSCPSDRDLANRFGDFFVNKIIIIRDNISALNNTTNENMVMTADIKFNGQPMRTFTPATQEEIRKIILNAPSKSC
ncbi:hypothetical protein LSH36_734g01020 [Paralvinella palmiformis]|uniref:Endonuclease/exonuclease/phosphatase domain-containing protein n=1 Tax=Paralvinella palmiformis TaxID=53620 RepID=A0AAD9MT21_9ANNE|nr:hypothetical protein LSH36_734g01020 [Paralvinella palmiformis]